MSNPFTGEPELDDLTLTATPTRVRADGRDLEGTVADGTDAKGGPIRIHVSDSAETIYGLPACVDAVERYLNTTLRRDVRLGAAVEIGKWGTFEVVATETGPYVIPPEQRSLAELLAA